MARGAERSPEPGAAPPAFLERLGRRADPDGFVPFERFMDVALYDPQVGYYARGVSPPGPAGDFYTAPQLSPLFARCVAARAADAARLTGPRRPFAWVELGPGDGSLSAEVVPDLARRLEGQLTEAVLVDRSEALLARAADRLRASVGTAGPSVRCVGSIAELGPVRGFVFANELLDAQPVARYRRTATGWVELGVRLGAGHLVPVERPVPAPPTVLAGARDAGEGTVLERSLRAEALVRELADHLTEGAVVLVDYAAEGSERVARYPHGTVAAVRGHRAVPDPYSAPGETDLSAFVDFERVRTVARSAGLREIAYRSQAEALVAWGLERLLEEEVGRLHDPTGQVKARLAVKKLLFGFETFRVLELAAGGA